MPEAGRRTADLVQRLRSGGEAFASVPPSTYSLSALRGGGPFDVVFVASSEQALSFFDLGPVGSKLLKGLWPRARVRVGRGEGKIVVWPAAGFPLGEAASVLGSPVAGRAVEGGQGERGLAPEGLALALAVGYTCRLLERGGVTGGDVDRALAGQ
ncbi:MAG: hypothetical protein JRN29_03735 [Nitrososphaerota archaeon]|nr:hypothetical protein [Nitrososphaerota archaeon]